MNQGKKINTKINVVVKSPLGVMPVSDRLRDEGSGIHNQMNLLDSGLRRNDAKTEKRPFYERVNIRRDPDAPESGQRRGLE